MCAHWLFVCAFWATVTAEPQFVSARKNNTNTSDIPTHSIDEGDTAWMLASTALVFLMTPGLAFFYGGMVRTKNIINTMMMSFLALGLITVHWVVFGYSFSYAGGNIVYGTGKYIGLRNVGLEPNPDYAPTIPHLLFCVYQMTFAIITPAIISGAVVERMSFRSYVIFMLVWTTLVYDMIAHWVWSSWQDYDDESGEMVARFGWLRGLGVLDFAGGTVVHLSAGTSSMVAALIVGRRTDVEAGSALRPANSAYTLLGGALLWFGWFGFNSGSTLSSSGLAALALVNTQIATGAAFVTWIALDLIIKKTTSPIGAMNGAVIGLVGITPNAGFVEPAPSLAIGCFTCFVCYSAAYFKEHYVPRLFPSYDDSLDAFTAHGVGGIIGTGLVGFFCTSKVNPAVTHEGILYGGDGTQFGYQLAGICSVFLISVVVTAVTLLVLKHTIGLVVDAKVIERGLDHAVHGEGKSSTTVASVSVELSSINSDDGSVNGKFVDDGL